MCGIIGYIGFQDPKGILLDGLKRLEYRGYDSAGIAIVEDNKTLVFRAEGRIQQLENKLTARQFQGSLGIGHTRWATHGAPTENNAHPHQVGTITLVHNGIIENYLEHKSLLEKSKATFSSETDTEVLAHLFNAEIKTGIELKEAALKVLPTLKGSYAFVAINEKQPDQMIGVSNGAPLIVGLGQEENYLASDVQAILHRTNKVIYLQDGQIAICKKKGVEVFSREGKPVKPEIKTLHWTSDQMEKSGYRHFMLKEIHEQSQAIANTISGNVDPVLGTIHIPELNSFQEKIKNLNRISIVACGTARHAGLVGKYYLEKFAQISTDVDFGSEFRYRKPVLEKNSITLLISQSGETADTLAGLRESKAQGVPTLSICNVRESSLARESDIVLYTNAGPEIGVASTKAFTTQLTFLYMLAVQLGQIRNVISMEYAKELTNDLMHLPILVDRTLRLENKVEEIAQQFQDNPFFFYMGRDALYPIALEGALKLKEISYAHAEGHPAGELKHGPIALIDRQAAVIVLATEDSSPKTKNAPAYFGENILSEKTLSNLQQVKARGGQILTVGTEENSVFPKESKFFIGLPKAAWALNPILSSIPLQLLAYHIASLRGTDVDKPRNLAKSVTVE
jgi:glucosamine--fructose-6-phosphate aminotransferase (isomerizing)